jgi:hypothetical protein
VEIAAHVLFRVLDPLLPICSIIIIIYTKVFMLSWRGGGGIETVREVTRNNLPIVIKVSRYPSMGGRLQTP